VSDVVAPSAVRTRARLSAASSTFAGNRLALIGAVLVGFLVFLMLLGFVWTPYPPDAVDVKAAYQSPSLHHLMGTDELGRDILSRLIVGTIASLAIAGSAVAGALVVGGLLAVVAGYFGGPLDLVLTRLMDILLAVPALLIALGLVAVMGPSGSAVAVSLAVAYAPTFMRVIRSAIVSERHQPYVEASQGLGASSAVVVAKDILPNIMPLITVQATSSLAWALLDEAALGFLGLGVQPPTPSWGSLLIEGRIELYNAPWLAIGAGIPVLIGVFGFNLLGDGLRDVMDPRSWRRR
jgi:ABC-type dipeptide/oligopeptide/nickel transport system permease subunit